MVPMMAIVSNLGYELEHRIQLSARSVTFETAFAALHYRSTLSYWRNNSVQFYFEREGDRYLSSIPH